MTSVCYQRSSILKHLPFKKFKNPSWEKAACVIIACGSFSPPTYLHLHLRNMEEARNCLRTQFEVIGGILSHVHDHYGVLYKPSLKAANGAHRAAMAQLATQSSDWIGVSDFEVSLAKWDDSAVVLESYGKALNHHYQTYESEQKEDCQNAPKHIHLKFVCGSDVLYSMTKPGVWITAHQEIIVGKHGVVVVERDGHPLDDQFFDEYELFKKYKQHILAFQPFIKNTISSKKVRSELQKKRSINI
eukprot:462258_1